MPSTELVQTRSGRGLLDRFLWPMCFHEGTVEIKNPLTHAAVDQLLREAGEGSPAALDLEMRLQQLASQIVPHDVHIRITEQELLLVVAAYHVAWQLHFSADDRSIWERRQRNLDDEVLKLVESVPPPQTEGTLLTRHLLLRHLPVAYRTDTRVEFLTFWGPLTFRGQPPKWTQLPLRRTHDVRQESVWLRDHVDNTIASVYVELLRKTPLTKLVHAPRLGALFDWVDCVPALATPGTCRFVTNTILNEGLAPFLPVMSNGFLAFCQDGETPSTHRRYIARFLLNLWLTHLLFVDNPTGYSGHVQSRVRSTGPPSEPLLAAAHTALFAALYDLRGPLGAAHLFSDSDLTTRVEIFLVLADIDDGARTETREAIAKSMNFETTGASDD